MATSPAPKTAKKQIGADVRRELLVAAALRVMKREGIVAATTRAICAEADMPHGAFHYCFRSKKELYIALLSVGVNVTLDAVWPSVVPGGDIAEMVKALLHAYWAAVEADPDAQLVLSELITLALRDPELSELPAWEHRAYLDKTTAHLERFANEARLELAIDTRVAAEMIITAASGVVSSWLSHRDSEVAVKTLDNFADLFATLIRSRSA
ncbi:TetR/AcrR family transcriptional regulator [Streptomyces hydrogenans]|uniref:TetR/AcrR family transcriptional regulator n=1 Tax=Streptomyces hydrogenans TaxID=1873719 RepID=UPI00363026AA